MTTIAGIAHAAHNVASSILANPQIQPGGTISQVAVKEDNPEKPAPLSLTGINVIVGVPGAFTGTCNAQIPGYIENYDKFKGKGVNQIYVVTINDVFVTKAWKEKLAPNGTPIHFIADDRGGFTTSLGLAFDAAPLLGSSRSKRYVIISEGDKITSIAVEQDPGKITVTSADTILAQLS